MHSKTMSSLVLECEAKISCSNQLLLEPFARDEVCLH